MHVLVTGGHGFIGHALCRRLLATGHTVTVVDLPRFGVPSRPTVVADGYRLIAADVLDVDTWGDALDDVDVIVHTAGVHHVRDVERDPTRHIDVNVFGTLRLLRAARAHGVRRMIHLSTAKVYGQIEAGRASREDDLVAPVEAYALGKVVAEQYCSRFRADTPLEVSVIRPFSVYGPGQDTHTGYIGALLESLRRGRWLGLEGRPGFRRDFVHVDVVVDLCAHLVSSASPPPAVVNAGSGRSVSLAELVAHFEQLTDGPFDVEWIAPQPATLEATLADTTVLRSLGIGPGPDLTTGLRSTIDEVAAR